MSFWGIFPVSAVIVGPLCTFWCWNIKPAGPQSCCNMCWHRTAFRQRANSTGLKHWPRQFSALCLSCSSVESCYLNVLSSNTQCWLWQYPHQSFLKWGSSDLCYHCPAAQHICHTARHSTACSLRTWHGMSMNKGFKRNNILKQTLRSYCLCFLRPRGWTDTCV